MSIGIITSIKSIKEIIWPNFLTYQKYYDLCRSKVTAPNKFCGPLFVPNSFCSIFPEKIQFLGDHFLLGN